jgi:TolB-like protein
MRREDGYVKVLDFGLAKLTERQRDRETERQRDGEDSFRLSVSLSFILTKPGVVMGTVTYMSPEQARGDDVDVRSDIFSLGVVLYEMLTGRVPFDERTTSDVIAALLEREPQPLESHINGLPAQFQQIIERALAKPVEQRYASMTEMLADLQKLKQDLELASNRKRYGKTKSAEQSLLEMRVGHDVAERPTSGTPARTTAKPSNVVQWVKTHRGLALVGALLIALAGITFQAWLSGRLKFETEDFAAIDSIAVLPFADNTNDAQLNYLPDGLTESLINHLSRLPNLRVMASGAVAPYKKRTATPQEVGQELNVRAVVSGRIQKISGKLLIHVEMANARDGSRLWGEQYERPLSHLLKMQNDIVREISQQLRGQLTGAQQQQLASFRPANNDAYQAYLKGQYIADGSVSESAY